MEQFVGVPAFLTSSLSPIMSRSHHVRRTVTALLTIAALVLVSGCGLRFESAAPVPPGPGPDGVARIGVVTELGYLGQDLDEAFWADMSEPDHETLAALVEQNFSQELILGVLPELSEETEAPDPRQPIELKDPQDVIDRVLLTAELIRDQIPAPEDPDLARLFGSMALGKVLLAQSLADSNDLEFVLPAALTQAVPQNALAQIDPSIVATLIQNEDGAGYGFEVIAAMSEPEFRTAPRAQARVHRDQAQFWAEIAGVDATLEDPRRVAYELPFTLGDEDAVASPDQIEALIVDLQTTLTTNYVDLIAHATPSARPFFFDAAVRSALSMARDGEVPAVLPFFSGEQVLDKPLQ